ncbi:hypothetical protein FACS1894132_05970 [Clostridia bacterium]|nr:hypothetical protein FACS1894132_05970 [Clostridia bacterium]
MHRRFNKIGDFFIKIGMLFKEPENKQEERVLDSSIDKALNLKLHEISVQDIMNTNNIEYIKSVTIDVNS